MQGIEVWNKSIVVQARWLIDNVFTNVNTYKSAIARRHLRVVRRGGNGRTALVDWQSMAEGLKRRVVEVLGCEPTEAVKKTSLLLDVIRDREAQCKDMEAGRYYSSLTDRSGRLLPEEKTDRMYNGARILAAISDCLAMVESVAAMRKQRFSIRREFEGFARLLAGEIAEVYPHSLPGNPRRLQDKWREFKEVGYEALVHGLTGKEGNRKPAMSEEDAK